MNTISYAITTHNEGSTIDSLLGVIMEFVGEGDEIVILDDYSTDGPTLDILKKHKFVTKRRFKNNYSDHKNYLNSLCKKNYIFQFDGDEVPSRNLLKFTNTMIRVRDDIDLYWIPRENKLYNIDTDYINKLNWSVDPLGRIQYPDYQGRLYKNKPHIHWYRDVHEMITGHDTYLILPQNSDVDILHHREMEHQIRSNTYYDENFK